MKKFLLSFLCLLATCLIAPAETIDLTFQKQDSNWSSIQNYTTTATSKDGEWKIVNFSNNQLRWDYLRCGEKNKTSVASASIQTAKPLTQSINKFTVTVKKASYGSVNNINLYISDDATFDASDTKITKNFNSTITENQDYEFEIANPAPNKYYCFEVTYTNNNKSKNGVLDVYKLSFEIASTKSEGNLAFDQASYEATLGEEFTSPQPSTWEVGEGSTITYTSENPEVATVNNDGIVTLVGAGSTTITVNATETETHTAATASYTLTVAPAAGPIKPNFSIAGVENGILTLEMTDEGFAGAILTYSPADIDSSKLTLAYDDNAMMFEPSEDEPNVLNLAILGTGEYPITISYPGDGEKYLDFTYTFTAKVTKKALNITFNPAEVTVTLDETATMPIATPYFDDLQYSIFNVTENRAATAEELLIEDYNIYAFAIGEYTVTASYPGNATFEAGEGSFKVTVTPKESEFILDKETYELSKLNEPQEIVYAWVDGGEVKFEATPAEGITFKGNTFTVTAWGNYTVTATATANGYKTVTKEISIIAENPFQAETVTDIITYASFTTKTQTSSYENFDYTSSTTGIKYHAFMYGQKSADYIQIVTDAKNNVHTGIFVTENKNGYTLKDIKFEIKNSYTADVYSKDSAFESASAMFTSGKEATKIGAASNSSTLTITPDKKDIQYIGIRSNSGALQITKITITWEKKKELTFAEHPDFTIEHIYADYEENSKQHGAEHSIKATSALYEKYHEAVKATITHDNWDLSRYYTSVPEGVDEEAFHQQHHYDFFQAPEVKDYNTDFVKFTASHAGRYILTLDVKDEYKDVLNCTPKTYAINVTPAFQTSDFSDRNDLGFSDEALKQLRLYVEEGEGENLNGYTVAIYTDKGWQLSSNHNLSKVFVDAKYRKLYYQIEEKATAGDPEFRPAAKAEATTAPEGFTLYSGKNGIDLSNAKSLTLIADENGVQSAPAKFEFTGTTETAVDAIESENLETEYYSIEGIRVEAPLAPGIYVARRGADAKVIMVK